jgi:hypothetical protein
LVKAKLWLAFRRDQVLSIGISAEQPMLMVAAAQDAVRRPSRLRCKGDYRIRP